MEDSRAENQQESLSGADAEALLTWHRPRLHPWRNLAVCGAAPASGLVKTCQVCPPFQDRGVPLNVHLLDKRLDVLHVGLPICLPPLDGVEVGAGSPP